VENRNSMQMYILHYWIFRSLIEFYCRLAGSIYCPCCFLFIPSLCPHAAQWDIKYFLVIWCCRCIPVQIYTRSGWISLVCLHYLFQKVNKDVGIPPHKRDLLFTRHFFDFHLTLKVPVSKSIDQEDHLQFQANDSRFRNCTSICIFWFRFMSQVHMESYVCKLGY